jgi:UDP-glucose 4-epimerase
MNCLVIGGTGFIGSHITRKLVNEGLNVITYSPSGNPRLLLDIVNRIKIERGSTTELAEVLSVMKKHQVKVVVYAAAEHPPWTPMNIVKTMILGFTNVLEASRLMDVERLVWTSSYAQLGPPELYPTERVNEDAPVKPGMLHAPSYVSNEYMANQYYEMYGLDVLSMRLGINFGPGRERRGVFDFIIDLFENPLLKKPVRVPNGDAKYTLQYVKDAAEAIWFGVKAKSFKHRVFNTCDEACTLRELAQYVKEEIPDADITVEPGGKTPRVLVDASRIRQELGYTPRYGIKGGAKDYLQELRKTLLAGA